jgi:hypothetical protein
MAESMETGVKKVHISSTAGQIPMQEMSRLTPQTKEATAVSVGAGATVNVSISDMDGYTDFGVSLVASAAHNYQATAFGSPDGSTVVYSGIVSESGSGAHRKLIGTSPLNYLAVQVINNDVSARTYDVWLRKMNK